jgi:hypothetical protein
LAIALFIIGYKFMIWISPQLLFYSKDGTIESDWTGTGGITSDTTIRVGYLDDKQCKPYGSYDCLAVFNQKQITNCKLIGEFWVVVFDDRGLTSISDLNLGVKEIEGQYIILSDGTITCQPPNGNWRNGIGAITGSYTVYDANNNPITIDCDNKVFISKYKTANYDCNSLFQTRGIQNFKVVFYGYGVQPPTQPSPKKCANYNLAESCPIGTTCEPYSPEAGLNCCICKPITPPITPPIGSWCPIGKETDCIILIVIVILLIVLVALILLKRKG